MFKDKDAERCEHNGEGVHGGSKRLGAVEVKRMVEEKRRIKEEKECSK
jgi:hypothetical protein